jgi:hypothetical protein
MEEMIVRGWNNIVSRFGGPMTFRVILQPAMAALLALLAGLKDAREHRPPYLWTVLTDSSQRGDLLRHGWKAIARVFILAIVMDTIYQLYVLRWLYPLELLLVAILLAVVPYLVLRGPVNRVASWWYRRRKAPVIAD